MSDVDQLKLSVTLQQRINELRLQLAKGKPRNDFNKGIFKLPEELICQVLDYVNQMDIIHLCSTLRVFGKWCKMKLMENIHIYPENKIIYTPKYWYGSRKYLTETNVNMESFQKLVRSTPFGYLPYLKNLEFERSDLVTSYFLDSLVNNNDHCVITIRVHSHLDKAEWISDYQRKVKNKNVILFSRENHELDESQIEAARYLEMRYPTKAKMENYLPLSQNYNTLVSLKLINPPNFTLLEKLRVSQLDLTFPKNTTTKSLKEFSIALTFRK
ncbi:hypothetical protein Cantr_07943 [Candida viswanathii]|uniref:F-box domain-containing protein n=1 Tax=Candida viswanathii TaxID=5486 RepID=A0A367Y0N6_9ASCO|nr:hypothetical protein Cantr_07943 [Candida viswanathii]